MRSAKYPVYFWISCMLLYRILKISCIKVIKFDYQDRWTVKIVEVCLRSEYFYSEQIQKHRMFLAIWTVNAKFEEVTKQLVYRFRKFGNMLTNYRPIYILYLSMYAMATAFFPNSIANKRYDTMTKSVHINYTGCPQKRVPKLNSYYAR